MPFIQVHTSRRPAVAERRALGLALAKVYADAMETTQRIVNVAFLAYDEGDVARYDGAGDTAREMTIVTCNIRSGRPPAMIEALGRAITAVIAPALGIAPERIAVYVTEHDAAMIYRDGGRAPEWSAHEMDEG